MRVLRIEPTQEPEIIDIENTLKSLQHQVEGNIECVTLAPGHVEMIVNEEGWLLNLPFNELASVLSERQIVGTVLILQVYDDEFIDISDCVIRNCERIIQEWKEQNNV